MGSCPACQTITREDSFAFNMLSLEAAPIKYMIRRCPNCHLRELDPYPKIGDYQSLYSEQYYESPQQGGSITYRSEKQELARCYELRAKHFSNSGVLVDLLDIGCGTGDFIGAARNEGIAITGVEPSAYAVNIARDSGYEVISGTIFDLPDENHKYNGIHCSHVLEHVPDVTEFLNRISLLLKPNGLLYVEVPLQFDNILEQVMSLRGKRYQFSAHSIHHHYFFSPKALSILLEQHGFVIESMTTFLPCRRAMRKPSLKKWTLQSMLWLADRMAQAGDVISIWARRRQ